MVLLFQTGCVRSGGRENGKIIDFSRLKMTSKAKTNMKKWRNMRIDTEKQVGLETEEVACVVLN